MDQVSQFCGQLFSQGKEETAPESARLAVCQIIHKQSLGLGFLAFNQKLNKCCIVTTDKVVLNDHDDYKVQFSRKSRPTKTFNLKEIIKETVKHDSGLVTIFIDHDSSCLMHNKKPCSILTSYLIIANRDEKKQQFCYVGNKRYDLCASGQHGKPCLKHVNNDSNTTAQSTNTSQETLEGSVILQRAGDNASFEAVGMLSAKDETWDVIWLNSAILDPADQPDPDPEIDTGDGGQNISEGNLDSIIRLLFVPQDLSDEKKEKFDGMFKYLIQEYLKNNKLSDPDGLGALVKYLKNAHNVVLQSVGEGSLVIEVQCPTLESLESLWNDYRSGHLNEVAEKYLVTNEIKGKLNLETVRLKTTITENNYWICKEAFMKQSHGVTTDHASPSGNPKPPVAPAGASNGEPPDHANGELPTDGRTPADHESPSGNPEPPVAPTDASNGEPPDHVNGLSTDGRTTADHESPPVVPAGASNGEPPDRVNRSSTDGRTTTDHDSTPDNQDLPSLTGFSTQEEQEETSYNYKDCLVSEKVRGNKPLQHMLAVGLDRTCHRVIKTWEHLACTDEIKAPLDVQLRCKINGSCTQMLFEVLKAELGDKTVKDLVDALTQIRRNDVKNIITNYPNAAEKISDFFSSPENSELIADMATLLDQKSNTTSNWFHLGQQFKLSNEKLKEIEYGQFSPTEVMMKYLYNNNLTIGKFYDEVKKIKRGDVLKKLDCFIVAEGDREKLMKDVIDLESDAMRGIRVDLDNPNRALKNWSHLAKSSALSIPEDIYKDCEPGKPKSPTDLLFEWIFVEKDDLTVGQLCSALGKIDRNDLVRDLRRHFEQSSSG